MTVATLSLDKASPIPSFSEMVKLGMYDIQTRGIAISPTPGNRGIERHMRAAEWMTTITSFDPGRPAIRAIRATPEESDRDARLRFMAIFDKGQKLDPVMDHPSRINKPSKVQREDDDSDLDELI